MRGPGGPDEAAATVVILARRFRCMACRAVILVVPCEVRARRLYSASAIAFALALWGLVRATAAEVRRRVGPAAILGDTAARGWTTLRRWARAVARGDLFPSTPPAATDGTLRSVAAGAAAALAASSDPTTRRLPDEHRAFLGAAHAA